MSKVTTTIEDHLDSKCSILQFAVDSIPVTKYTYQDGIITLAERTTKHYNTLAGFKSGLQTVGKWMRNIETIDNNSKKNNLKAFKMSSVLNKKGVLQFQYYIGKSRVIRVQYHRTTKLLTFLPRSEISMNLEDFYMLYLYNKSLIEFIQLIQNVIIDDELETEITNEILE
jgi:hypothetical protein